MGILKEFKDFAIKGNVIDLAVGVIIGAAFGKIITSLVEDIIMPFITTFLPASRWEKWNYKNILYGKFMSAIIYFFIVAFILFLIIKAINAIKRIEEGNKPHVPPPPVISSTDKLLMEIRDTLKEQP